MSYKQAFGISLLILVIHAEIIWAKSDGGDSSDANLQKTIQFSRKSATAAFLLGLGPGFFVHGAGHYYIGDKSTGNILLATELVSIPIMLIAMANGTGSMGTGEENSAIQTAEGMAIIVFLGSWALDFLGAPNKVINSRRALAAKTKISLSSKRDIIKLELAISF